MCDSGISLLRALRAGMHLLHVPQPRGFLAEGCGIREAVSRPLAPEVRRAAGRAGVESAGCFVKSNADGRQVLAIADAGRRRNIETRTPLAVH